MWPEIESRVPGEVEHKKTLIYFLQRRVNLSVTSCKQTFCSVSTVPVTGTFFIPTQMWPEISVSRVPGGK